MKKLSTAQQKVVDLLKQYPTSYVSKSPYYNHNNVNLPKDKTKFPHFYQFTRPTFEFLENKGIIKHLEGTKYILADSYQAVP